MGEDGPGSKIDVLCSREVLPSRELDSDVLGRLSVRTEEPPDVAIVVSESVMSTTEVDVKSILVGDMI